MHPLLIYLIIINVATFLVWGLDKVKAMWGWWRISEKQLLTLVALGGVAGALMGMKYFRHKTLKGSFLMKFYTVTIAWIIIVLLTLKDPALIQEFLEPLKNSS